MKKVALVFAFVISLAAAPLVLAETPIWSMDVEGVDVSGSVAMVTVSNSSTAPASALLEIEAVVAGRSIRVVVPVSLQGDESATFRIAFRAPVSAIANVSLEKVP